MKILNIKKSFFNLILTFIFGILFHFVNAQVSILYTSNSGTALENNDVITCYDNTGMINQVRLVFTDNGADNTIITIGFPEGVEYASGSVSTIEQSGGLSVLEMNITDLSNPVFSVSPGDISSGDFITIQWARIAICESVDYQANGGVFKDKITVNTDMGQVVENDPNVNSYDLLVASLSMFGEGPISTTVGQSVTRSVTITNGGLGLLEDFTFFIIEGNGTTTTQLETPGGSILNPTVIGDTLFYTVDGAIIQEFGDNDIFYENGEQVLLTRTYTVNSCDNDSYYQAFWGCPGRCQKTDLLLQQTNILNLIPNLKISIPNPNNDYCFNGDNAKVGGTPIIQTIKVENIGNGPASNFELSLFNYFPGSGTGQNYFSDDLWVVKDAGGSVIATMDNFNSLQTGTYRDSNCQSSTQANRVSQSSSTLIIGAGETVYIEVPVYTDNVLCSGCPGSFAWEYITSIMEYQDQCEINNYNDPIRRLHTISHNIQNYTVEMPTDLRDNQLFDIDISYSNIYTNVHPDGLGSTYLIVDLAGTGLIYVGPPTVPLQGPGSSYTFDVTVVGDKIRAKMPNNKSGLSGLIKLNMQASCSLGGGSQIVDFYHETKYDESCSGGVRKQNCQGTSFEMHCPIPCPKGGATPIFFTMERKNLGLEDLDDNGIPDGTGTAQPQDVNVHRAVNGDTVTGKWEIKVHPNTVGPNAGIPFNYTYIEFDTKAVDESCSAQTPRTSYFTALPNANVTVFPSGGGTPINCTVTPTVTNGIAKYNLSGCKSTWEGGDSIYMEADYVVNAYYVKGGFYHYVADNEVYSSYIADPVGDNPSDENKYTCDHYNDFLNIFNIIHSPYYPSPQVIQGCNNQIRVNMRTYINVQGARVWFPNEYRNFELYDEYVLNWPAELEYRPGSATFHGFPIDDADVTQIGNELRFTNLKKFYTLYGGSILPPDEILSEEIYFSVDPSCEAVAGSSYNVSFYGVSKGNGLNTPSDDWESYISCNGSKSGGANVTYEAPKPFISGGGEVQYTTENICWDVILNNGSNSLDANNTWFYLEDISGTLSNFKVIRGGVEIIPDANGFYELGDNLHGASTPYTVCAVASDCDTAKLDVLTGYHCSQYPSTIVGQECADRVNLFGIPLKSEAQLEVVSEPVPPLAMCETNQIAVKVSSAQAAYLDNPVLDIIVPLGASIAGDISVEYPEGSGNIEVLTPVVSGQVLKISLEDHSQIGDVGLPGTVDALTPEERAAIVSFDFVTDCDFISGSNFTFQVFGYRPCGDQAIGFGIKAKTADLTIIGADKPYATDIQLNINSALEGCNPTDLNVDMTLTKLVADMTSPNDSVFIALDPGISYVPGSYSCNIGSPCLTFEGSNTDINGFTTVLLAFPSSPIDLSGGSVNTSFNIQVETDIDSDCDLTKGIEVKSIAEIGNVSCSSEPSGSCPSVKVETGKKNTTVVLKKMVLSLNNFTTTCMAEDTVGYSLDVKIDSVDLMVGEQLLVDFYCANGAGMPDSYIKSEIIDGPVSKGTTITLIGGLNMNSCSLTNGIYVEINKDAQNGTKQCICLNVSSIKTNIEVCPCHIADIGKTNEQCNDGGTNSDPADDYISFDLNPVGTNPGSGYTVSVDNGGTITPVIGNYGGITSFQLQGGSADGSVYTVTLTDNDDPNCSITTTVQQNSCSDVCLFTDAGKENEVCNNAGTSGDPTDDYITFDLNPVGFNFSASGYTVSVSGATITPNSGIYGQNTTFQLHDGSANGLSYIITIIDNDDPNCTITTMVQQNSCSTCSTSATFTTDCDDNGTLPNKDDDYFNLSVTGTVTDGTGNYVVKIGAYTSASTPSGTVVNITGDGQGGNPMLAADGASTYIVKIEDASDSSCYTEYTVGPVDECSECPTPDCLNVQVKKSN